jgi:hypothetical protein
MQEKRIFKSIHYYQHALDLAHCDEFGFDKNPVFKRLKNYNMSRKKMDMIYKWKLKDKSKWDFFEKHCKILANISQNWQKLSVYDRNEITEYKDFFVYRFDGLVYRWDGKQEFRDVKGRALIKTFSGTNKLVIKIIYATRPLAGYFYSYRKMKTLKVTSKNGTRNVMELKAKK